MNCEFWITGIPIEHSKTDLHEFLLCFHSDVCFGETLLSSDSPHKAIKVVFFGENAYQNAYEAMNQMNNTIIGDSVISIQIIHKSQQFAPPRTPPPPSHKPAPATTTSPPPQQLPPREIGKRFNEAIYGRNHYIFVFDTSKSMDEQDVKPTVPELPQNRLGALIQGVNGFVGEILIMPESKYSLMTVMTFNTKVGFIAKKEPISLATILKLKDVTPIAGTMYLKAFNEIRKMYQPGMKNIVIFLSDGGAEDIEANIIQEVRTIIQTCPGIAFQLYGFGKEDFRTLKKLASSFPREVQFNESKFNVAEIKSTFSLLSQSIISSSGVKKILEDDAVDGSGAPIERTITLESIASFPAETTEGWSDFERVKVHFIGSNGEWKRTLTEVKIRQKPFARGGFRNAFFLYTRDGKKMVAKQSRYANKYNSLGHHMKDVYAQHHLNDVANCFNNDLLDAKFEKHYLAALPAYVYEFTSRPEQDKYFCVEPYMDGTHEKYNGNDGKIGIPAVGPNAFSHWTYQYTNPTEMILDIQGFGNILTDPQICTVAKNPKFNTAGNGGLPRMEIFFANHICNEVCKKLNLKEESNHGISETVPPSPLVKLFCHRCLKIWSPNIKAILASGNSSGMLHNWCDSCTAVEKEARCTKCNAKFKYPPFLFHCQKEEEPTVCLSCKNGTTTSKNPFTYL